MKKEITLNESFKALLESIFSDTDQAKKLIQAFVKNLLMIEQQRKGLILGI
ncbi:TPA: hypothetical protein R1616_001809 [Campylobacter jejuni]